MADAIRAGLSRPEAARAAGISRASVGRLLADPAFARGLRGEPIISLGPVAFAGHEQAPDPLAGVASRAWIMCRGEALEVLGSVLNPLADPSGPDALKAQPKEVVSASMVKIEFVLTLERADVIRAELAAGRVPPEDPVARYGVLTLFGLLHMQEHGDDLNSFIRMHGIPTWIPREEIPNDCPPDLRAALEAAADEADAFVAAQASPTPSPSPSPGYFAARGPARTAHGRPGALQEEPEDAREPLFSQARTGA